jgi:hypothetical protein
MKYLITGILLCRSTDYTLQLSWWLRSTTVSKVSMAYRISVSMEIVTQYNQNSKSLVLRLTDSEKQP